ncbi:MAG: hypothetical protein ACP5N1_06075 [Candidatus Woesearchaeota archaeon]
MINAKYDEEFIFNDGTRAKNLLELLLKIEHMESSEFHYFVNSSKNDFANWIGIVLNDTIFADQLRYVMTKEDTVRLIRSRINNLSTEIINSRQKPYDAPYPDKKDDSKVVSNNAIHILSTSAIHVSPGSNSIPNTLPETSKTEYDNSNNADIEKNLSRNYSNSGNSKGLKASRNWFKMLNFRKTKNSELVHDVGNVPLKTENIEKEKSTAENNVKISDNKSSSKYYTNIYTKYLSGKKFWNKKLHHAENNTISKKDHVNHVKNLDDEHESALWFVTYIVLVVLIVALLIYKLFF